MSEIGCAWAGQVLSRKFPRGEIYFARPCISRFHKALIPHPFMPRMSYLFSHSPITASAAARKSRAFSGKYRSIHVPVDLGWVRLTLISVFHTILPSCTAAPAKFRQHKQSQANSGTLEIQVNKTQSTSTWDTLYTATWYALHSLVN